MSATMSLEWLTNDHIKTVGEIYWHGQFVVEEVFQNLNKWAKKVMEQSAVSKY